MPSITPIPLSEYDHFPIKASIRFQHVLYSPTARCSIMHFKRTSSPHHCFHVFILVSTLSGNSVSKALAQGARLNLANSARLVLYTLLASFSRVFNRAVFLPDASCRL